MKFKPLPIEIQLANIQATQGTDEMVKSRAELFLQWARMPGFQFLTAILREQERAIQQALTVANDPLQIMRLVGSLKIVEQIRTSLSALVPVEQRSAVEWFDDAEEDYLGPLEQGT